MLNHSDKFDHLIALAATKCAEDDAKELQDLDTSDVTFDASYYKKKNKIIRTHKNTPSRSRFKTKTFRWVAAVIVIITMFGVLIGCVPRLRQAIYDAIVGWYDKYFTVSFESPSGQEQESAADENLAEEKVAPTYIEEPRKPTNLPEGVWEDEVIHSNAKIIIDYYVGEDYLFSFTQFLLKPFDKYVDNEEMDVTYTEINGFEATVIEYQYKDEICILWNDGEYAYQISSNTLGAEALIQYASSVK
ncbi:MAG: DUF4367 domain-containing protein [Clostridia bacterium]|nr:DUF4367 domain-containing protein [Clostridia bacterium]